MNTALLRSLTCGQPLAEGLPTACHYQRCPTTTSWRSDHSYHQAGGLSFGPGQLQKADALRMAQPQPEHASIGCVCKDQYYVTQTQSNENFRSLDVFCRLEKYLNVPPSCKASMFAASLMTQLFTVCKLPSWVDSSKCNRLFAVWRNSPGAIQNCKMSSVLVSKKKKEQWLSCRYLLSHRGQWEASAESQLVGYCGNHCPPGPWASPLHSARSSALEQWCPQLHGCPAALENAKKYQ